MAKTIFTVSSLLLGIGILLTGNGLQSTLLALRSADEGFTGSTIGMIMSMYFIGFAAGTFLCPAIIDRVGHIRTFTAMAAICASSMVMIGLWIDPWTWAIMRFILCICIVRIFMVTESWLNMQATNENRGQIFAIYILINLVFLAAIICVIAAAAVMAVPPESLYWLSVCMFVFGGMMFSIYPLSVAHTNDHPEATDRVAITTNLLFVFGIGAAVGPAIGGFLMHLLGRYSLCGLFIAAGIFLAVYAWYWKQHGIKIRDEDKTHFTPLLRTSQAAMELQSPDEIKETTEQKLSQIPCGRVK